MARRREFMEALGQVDIHKRHAALELEFLVFVLQE